MSRVSRPVWRSFDPRWRDNAVAHVQRGGHAVLRGAPRWTLLLPSDDGDLPELTVWALLDLGLTRVGRTAEGLATVVLPDRLRDRVTLWCERDATHRASLVRFTFDCQACAMCCRKNRVVLDDMDEARWTAAGRSDLSAESFVRASRGRRVLRVLPGGDCVHLADTRCAIYPLRPDNCRAFPAGSEGCLSAREG